MNIEKAKEKYKKRYDECSEVDISYIFLKIENAINNLEREIRIDLRAEKNIEHKSNFIVKKLKENGYKVRFGHSFQYHELYEDSNILIISGWVEK